MMSGGKVGGQTCCVETLTLCLHEGVLEALVLGVAPASRLQLHAELLTLHQRVLFLQPLLLQLRLQTVDLRLELRDVALSLENAVNKGQTY